MRIPFELMFLMMAMSLLSVILWSMLCLNIWFVLALLAAYILNNIFIINNDVQLSYAINMINIICPIARCCIIITLIYPTIIEKD